MCSHNSVEHDGFVEEIHGNTVYDRCITCGLLIYKRQLCEPIPTRK